MGVNLNQGNPLGRRKRNRAPMSEINITPFVDVMLVLLIIFMVTAPLLTSGVHVDLPETSASPLTGQDEPLAITLTADGGIYLQKQAMKLDELVPKLQAVTKAKKDTRIFVRADRKVSYGQVMQVVGAISAAGYNKVAFITENPEGKS